MNILFIVVDDLRTTLSCYGDDKAYTPNIDNLAEKSIVFTKAFAQQSLCAPSRNSFLTSRRPDTLQLYDFYSYWRDSVGNFTTLPEHLKNNGYTTMSVGKVFHPGISSNGSDDYPYSWSDPPFHPYTNRYKDAPLCQATVHSLPAANLICPVCVPCMPNQTLPDIETLNAARKFIHEHHKDQNPFFLAVGFQKPHIPLKYPQQYLKYHPLSKFMLPDPYAWPANISNVVYNPWTDIRKREDVRVLLLKFPWEKVPPAFAKLIIQSYYSAVTYVDDLIGILLDQLHSSKIDEDTIVILTSDHGWSLGEHAEWAKYSNFDVALHVPLMFSIPGLTYNISRPYKTDSNELSTDSRNRKSVTKEIPLERLGNIQEHKDSENPLDNIRNFEGNKFKRIQNFNSESTEASTVQRLKHKTTVKITEMDKKKVTSKPFNQKITTHLFGEQELENDCNTKDNLLGIENATENLKMLLRQIEAMMRNKKENSKKDLHYNVHNEINDVSNNNRESVIQDSIEKNNSASSEYLVQKTEKIEALVKRFGAMLKNIETSINEPILSRSNKRKAQNTVEHIVTDLNGLRVKRIKDSSKNINIDEAEKEKFLRNNVRYENENVVHSADEKTVNDSQRKTEIDEIRKTENKLHNTVKSVKKRYPFIVTSKIINADFQEKRLKRLRILQANFVRKPKCTKLNMVKNKIKIINNNDTNVRDIAKKDFHKEPFFMPRIHVTMKKLKNFYKDRLKQREMITIKNSSAKKRYPTRNQKYVTVNSMVELVDIFPTIAELAGHPIPICPDIGFPSVFPNPCSEGVTLLPVITAAMSHKILPWKRAAFSQYPRPSVNPTLSPNSDKPRLNEINIMGYTIRTEKYRYTAWVPFAHTSKKPDWSTIIADELYDHDAEDGENVNVANSLEFVKIREQLRAQLKRGWRQALPN